MKSFLCSLFLLGALYSYAYPANEQPSDSTGQNESTVRAMFDALNKHDWVKMASFYAEDVEFLDPSLGIQPVRQTRKQIAEKYAAMASQIPDLNDAIQHIYVHGDKVIVEFIATGTLSDKKTFRLPICSVLTLKNGKIIRDATYYDL